MAELFFPIDSGRVSWNTSVSQTWNIEEQKSASGRRRTLCQQQLPGWKFKLTFPDLTRLERDDLLAFYSKCKGKHKSFLYNDFTDGHIERQRLNKGEGNKYQCFAFIGSYVEAVEYVDNVRVYLDGKETKNFTVSKGAIEIPDVQGKEVAADYDYYWRVCFVNDITVTQKFRDIFSASLTLEVVRE